jgi:hypothetical protein
MNKKHCHKEFKLKRQPTREVIYKTTELEDSNHYKISKDTIADYTVHYEVKDCYCVVATKRSTCSCATYAKCEFYKHVLYILKKKYLSSTIIACERKFAEHLFIT